ncbi:MAG: alpha/beta fold hydrolase [Anaerolineae bacterium]|nr:alpha/beta fold hydrolase [Anaerolineae bacterium]
MSASAPPRLNRRKRWRNRGLCFGLSATLGLCVILAFVMIMAARFAVIALDPARVTLKQSPRDVGITDYRDVIFTSSDEITISGWYVPSQNGATVILAHGFGGNREDLLPEAGLLAGHGYGVLLFDFRGHGISGDALRTVGNHEQRDLTAAIDFVIAQPEVDPAHVGAIGFSMGAATLAHVAAKDERLRAVVIESAFDTLDNVVHDMTSLFGPLTEWPARWSLQREGLDIDAVRPVDVVCNISPRPVFLIYGNQDDTVPDGAQAVMFAAACDPAETWLIRGAGHENFLDYAGEEYAARLLDFFDRELQK